MILTSIKSFMKNQKLLFAVFIILQILAVISTQYAFLGNTQRENDWIIYVEEATLFSVEFENGITKNKINKSIEQLTKEYEKEIISISIDLDDNIRAYYFGQNKVVNYGSSNLVDNNIIVSTNKEISQGKQIGEFFKTNTKTFNVIGLRTDSSYNEIFIGAIDDSLRIHTINIVLSYLPTISQKKAFLGYLQGIFPEANISPPIERSSHTESHHSSELILTITLLALSIVNIIFIFKYVIYKRQKAYIISRLCGATKKQIFVDTLVEYLLYCVSTSIIATANTKLIIIPIFYKSVYISINTLIIPIGIFLAMCICIIIPVLIKNSNLHILQNKVVKS